MFWNKSRNNRLRRAAGPAAVAAASLSLVTGCGLLASSPAAATAHSHPAHARPVHAPSKGPLPVDLLIADRGNNRLLIVTPQKKIVWSMHIGGVGGPHNANSLGPDDAFFTPDGKHIIINEESNNVVALIDIATKKVVWTYGHPGVAGSKPGYLNTPDDAYVLPNGTVTVADIVNQRILFISPQKKIIKQYGQTGVQAHNPPYTYTAPNGDTPTPGGGMIITEINGSYADRLNSKGKLMYTVHLPGISYPSDTQLLPNGNLLVADYSTPGTIEEVTPKGKLVWRYRKLSGPGELSNPSLAVMLPNGNIMANDDYNNRVVVINPHTNRIVWQYGHKGVKGTAPGYLNTPDGLELMPANVHLPAAT
ncbi:MAG: NHL repeat-containing protein [Bacilli bacterium]